MTDYGIKFSKHGKDVSSATNDDLIFSSGRNCLKVKPVASTTITVSGGSGSTTVAHGQSFVPFVIAYINFSGMQMLPFVDSSSGSVFNMTIDGTNLIITASTATNGTYTFYYYISETESAS